MAETRIIRPLLILIAGPYRSGTNDNPELIERNVEFMNQIALEVFQMGHIPLLGEWFALPLIATAGSEKIGDEIFNKIFNPLSPQIVEFCSAILRVGGPSVGADEMIRSDQRSRR
ncbi:MAG: DUF4406 domain-containing protein [Chryseolinea sp.]